ncbi:histone deacetylase family protein [Dermatobacter hominis]|uniref:histone deacetylase family protein n=1 Tax=Dermatobacter hominis TaxID=2884263 RepID=UPI001D11BC85|nr:histone deacetylase family protein [Dermatobacter hominis]UDY37407.1 histone deacetylase family protein [Dermatobacter hominis]
MRYVYSEDHARHAPTRELELSRFQEPFEHPGRATAIHDALRADPTFEVVAPESWGTEPISAVHDPGLVAFLSTAWERYQEEVGPTHDVVPDVFLHPAVRDGMGPAPEPTPVAMQLGRWCFETTTPLTDGTYVAARSSVDVALTAAALVLRDGDRAAFGLCRPPGHHAATAAYGGYCFFNNAAVAAHRAATAGARVALLDVDYHHGNGSQQIFYDRDDVLFASIHADPVRAYPYTTGFADETGTGRGLGATLNVPLAAGAGDVELAGALERALEVVARHRPDVVVVSLGLDMYESDPIADLRVTREGFHASGRAVRELGVPTVVLQEGGYATDELGRNATAWLRGLAGEPEGPDHRPGPDDPL